jgi:hypothetical protein
MRLCVNCTRTWLSAGFRQQGAFRERYVALIANFKLLWATILPFDFCKQEWRGNERASYGFSEGTAGGLD